MWRFITLYLDPFRERERFTCMEEDPLLLVPTFAIHMAWQLCPVPIHQPKAASLKSTQQYCLCPINTQHMHLWFFYVTNAQYEFGLSPPSPKKKMRLECGVNYHHSHQLPWDTFAPPKPSHVHNVALVQGLEQQLYKISTVHNE